MEQRTGTIDLPRLSKDAGLEQARTMQAELVGALLSSPEREHAISELITRSTSSEYGAMTDLTEGAMTIRVRARRIGDRQKGEVIEVSVRDGNDFQGGISVQTDPHQFLPGAFYMDNPFIGANGARGEVDVRNKQQEVNQVLTRLKPAAPQE